MYGTGSVHMRGYMVVREGNGICAGGQGCERLTLLRYSGVGLYSVSVCSAAALPPFRKAVLRSVFSRLGCSGLFTSGEVWAVPVCATVFGR